MQPRRTALLASAVLHLGIAAVVVFGVPWLPERDFEPPPPAIEVEIERVTDKTNPPPPAPKAEEKKPEPKPEPPKPEPQQAAPPPPPPPPLAEVKPEPKPEPKPQVAEPVPVPAAPKPKPKPAPPKLAEAPPPPDTKKFDADKLAALLDRRLKQRQPEPTPQPAPSAAPTQQRSPTQSNLQEPMTISELDAIRQQFERCWSPPVGAKDAANLIVRIRVLLNPDGSLRAPPELIDRSRMNDDFWRAAADSALRAVHRCAPLRNLPPGKYERWREIELTFNPRDMLG